MKKKFYAPPTITVICTQTSEDILIASPGDDTEIDVSDLLDGPDVDINIDKLFN